MNEPTGGLRYEKENILMGGQLYGTVSSGGNVITVSQNGETFTLTLKNN